MVTGSAQQHIAINWFQVGACASFRHFEEQDHPSRMQTSLTNPKRQRDAQQDPNYGTRTV